MPSRWRRWRGQSHSSGSRVTWPSSCDWIRARGLERTWLVGGGDLAGQLLAADLLDELVLSVAPTLVGRGPALADGEFPLRAFDLVELERLGDAGVRLRYVRKPSSPE